MKDGHSEENTQEKINNDKTSIMWQSDSISGIYLRKMSWRILIADVNFNFFPIMYQFLA